ncbi:MAG TPA: OpgC domain-containing protein [Aliidongia sp.]|nr:OpgC domain-containing protein [Aliidongia sp.]
MSIAAAVKFRDPRLDFFRGLSLFIILVSHTRGDWLADWIPARFGFSDAANMFVFVSGYAVGLAFGGVYRRRGWLMGSARIALRIWQLYLAQLVIVMIVAALAVAADRILGEEADHVALFSLNYFFGSPRPALLGIATLSYVPHYLDILPVYIAVLAMVPAAMALSRIHPWTVPVLSVALWAAANWFGWNLPTEPGEPRGWFFDPFCWQLLFFSGYSLSIKWVSPPPADRRIFWLAAAYLAFGVATTVPAIFMNVPGLDAVEAWILDHADKTMLDPLQYLHFLALAYVTVYLLRGRLHLIQGPAARPITRCGQQSLSVFLSGIVLAYLGAMAFDEIGDGLGAQILVNAAMFAATLAVAELVTWYKSTPWARAPDASAAPSVGGVSPRPEKEMAL